jgi:DNA-binding GntR family transcriptional regulator
MRTRPLRIKLLVDVARVILVAMSLRPFSLRGGSPRSHALYEYLREEILSGSLPPGFRLTEQDVAQAAEVSRTPVREALQRLESDGLVADANGRGLEVRGVSPEDLAELCAVREVLEGMAGELAARSASPVEVATIQAILQREVSALESGRGADAHVELNNAFHGAVWRASHNRYLASVLLGLRDRISRMQETTLADEARREEALTEHRALVDAIVEHNAEEAGNLARLHFRTAMAARLSMLGSRAQ